MLALRSGRCTYHSTRPAQRAWGVIPRRWGPSDRLRTLQGLTTTRLRIGDDLLDYVTAGPKMRKWYGQGKRLPRDGDGEQDPEEELKPDLLRDFVFVLDADCDTGEQVILQLILARNKVKVNVRNVPNAKLSYGPYVEPVSLDIRNLQECKKAFRDTKVLICTSKLGAAVQAAKQAGVEHVVLLSSVDVDKPAGFSFFGGEQSELRDPSREKEVQESGLKYTIVRTGSIVDAPGGMKELAISIPTKDTVKSSPISREDLAKVIVQAIQNAPLSSLTFQVMCSGPGELPDNWQQTFKALEPQTTS